MDDKQRTGICLEQAVLPNRVVIPIFAKGIEKILQELSVSVAGIPVEIRNDGFLNTSLEYYPYTCLLRCHKAEKLSVRS
jgi:hypothetical protein